jgi:hypothetical protein
MESTKRPIWQNRPSRGFVLFSTVMIGIALILGILFVAPSLSWKQSGSTYNRSPDGYGAWYDYMTGKQGVAIERWRQPLGELLQEQLDAPRMLLRVQPKLISDRLDPQEKQWLKKGNSLVIVGVRQPTTKAPFSSQLESSVGEVKVETARRSLGTNKAILDDKYGSVVWQPQERLTYVTTSHLAANAYQDEAGNFRLLEQLVTQTKQPILVDEFLHGYGQRKPRQSGPWILRRGNGRSEDNIFSYMARTPLMPLLVQGMIVLLIAVLAKNRRFGRLQSVVTPPLDNSEAYIQALSGALRQADSRDFVMETVDKAELRSLQRQMGLGDEPYALDELIQMAQQQPTPERAAMLQQLLKIRQQRRSNDEAMTQWLAVWQKLRK